MSQIDLLTVPECPSPRLRRIAQLAGALDRVKAKFGILTHHTPGITDGPWMALMRKGSDCRSIAEIMADEAEYYDENHRTAYGMTEADVVLEVTRFWYGEGSQELRDLVELRELEALR